MANMTALEEQFNEDMLNTYTTSKKELGYNPTRFLQMLSEYGGVQTAKRLIAKEGGSDGFTTLWEHHRLDLSVEALVLKPEYNELFTDEERDICKKRLDQYNYINA